MDCPQRLGLRAVCVMIVVVVLLFNLGSSVRVVRADVINRRRTTQGNDAQSDIYYVHQQIFRDDASCKPASLEIEKLDTWKDVYPQYASETSAPGSCLPSTRETGKYFMLNANCTSSLFYDADCTDVAETTVYASSGCKFDSYADYPSNQYPAAYALAPVSTFYHTIRCSDVKPMLSPTSLKFDRTASTNDDSFGTNALLASASLSCTLMELACHEECGSWPRNKCTTKKRGAECYEFECAFDETFWILVAGIVVVIICCTVLVARRCCSCRRKRRASV